MQPKQCGTCKFWKMRVLTGSNDKPLAPTIPLQTEDGEYTLGRCYRYPPQIVATQITANTPSLSVMVPEMWDNEWCGEWRRKIEPFVA